MRMNNTDIVLTLDQRTSSLLLLGHKGVMRTCSFILHVLTGIRPCPKGVPCGGCCVTYQDCYHEPSGVSEVFCKRRCEKLKHSWRVWSRAPKRPFSSSVKAGFKGGCYYSVEQMYTRISWMFNYFFVSNHLQYRRYRRGIQTMWVSGGTIYSVIFTRRTQSWTSKDIRAMNSRWCYLLYFELTFYNAILQCKTMPCNNVLCFFLSKSSCWKGQTINPFAHQGVALT